VVLDGAAISISRLTSRINADWPTSSLSTTLHTHVWVKHTF
jgi:hypothetical protein